MNIKKNSVNIPNTQGPATLLLFWFFFLRRGLTMHPWLGTRYIDQTALELTEAYFCLPSAGTESIESPRF